MAEINVKRFVDVNITSRAVSTINGTRDTVILYTPETIDGSENLIETLAEGLGRYPAETYPLTAAYLTIFFNNGGAKCLVCENKAYSRATLADEIAALDNQYILVCQAVPDANVEAGYSAMMAVASAREANTNIYGVNEKILITRTETVAQTDSVKNFAVKYSTTLGAEMTIAAYLTQIDVYSSDSVHDYAFTKEYLGVDGNNKPIYDDVTDANYASIITNNMNVDIYLASSVRNCGGSLKDGQDLVNEYVRIVLNQTITDRLLDVLVLKLKGTAGLNTIYATIANELDQYVKAGYLVTDKVWTDPTYTVAIDNITYTIIDQNTPLTTGYYITILPFSSLNAAEIAARRTPNIYVIIATQYGIRKIVVNGEAF